MTKDNKPATSRKPKKASKRVTGTVRRGEPGFPTGLANLLRAKPVGK